MNSYPLVEQTRNLVRFCKHPAYEALDESFIADFGFRNKESRFSILKNFKTLPGPDECFVHADIDARPVFNKLLGMNISYPELVNGNALSIYNSMNYYRSHIEEYFYHNGTHPLPPISGICKIYYADFDILNIEYELENNSETDVIVKLEFVSTPADYATSDIDYSDYGFSLSQKHGVSEKHNISAEILFEEKIDFARTNSSIKSSIRTKTICAKETLCIRAQVLFDINGKNEIHSDLINTKDCLKQCIAETEKVYQTLPKLSKEFERYEDLVLNATGTLRSLCYKEKDINGKFISTVHAGKCGVVGTWFWDSAFTMLGLALAGEYKNAYGAARLLVNGIKEDGTPPCKYVFGKYAYSYQQPILAWGIENLHSIYPDNSFIAYAYPHLCRYVKHWLEKWNVADSGLSVYPPGSSCWDDSLRWQSEFPIAYQKGENWGKRNWGKMEIDAFMNVDTNTYLYLECIALANFAKELGKNEDHVMWLEKAEMIAENINTHLYNQNSGIYQDKSIDGCFTEMISPSSFLPIYAGITPPDIAKRLCKEYLLNPKRFYSLLPFPTLDMKHPAFRSGGNLFSPPEYPAALVQQSYWHGRTWPHVSYWLVGAIYKTGLTKEADKAVKRILDAINKSEAIYECYDSLTGTGNGHAEFAWSSAAVLGFAFEYYKK